MSGPLPQWLDPLAIPASWLYGGAVRVRNAWYERPSAVHRAGVPVIAVGNLTVGGTGKTPLVTWIVQYMREHGANPAIAMRGYGSTDPDRADEAMEYRERLGDVDVIVGADRVTRVESYLRDGGDADCIILDDAFQHRRIHRDLDIVVMDLMRDAFGQRVLPAGWLREGVSSLARSDAVVVSHAERSDPDFAGRVTRAAGKPPVAWTAHRWRRLTLHDREGVRKEEMEWLTGRSAAVRLGIGHPGSVIEALVRLGCKVARHLPAGDHEQFSAGEVLRLVAASRHVDAIVMTLKDWVKARDVVDLALLECPIVVPELELKVVEGVEELTGLLDRVLTLR